MILQKCEQGQREQLQAIMGCTKLGIPWRTSKEVGSADECHVGSVEWCQQALGFAPVPDFYPIWLAGWWRRGITKTGSSPTSFSLDTFCKPSEGYKIGQPKIIAAGFEVPEYAYASDVVKFTNEWRYYVADGELLAAGWYDGTDENEPAPTLDITWPKGWCGAADFGRLDNHKMAVVEVHHPYACGNYLEAYECEAWVMWLELGWKWTLKNR